MVQSCCWKCGATPTPTPSVLDLPPPFSASSLDLTSLMSRNDAPLDAEIRVVVSDDQDQVDALDTQIHNLQATLAQLVRRRADAIERVRQHRATLYAIRRVPPELICEIFALTLSDDESDRATNPPWHLGHICRSWRYWALGYPHLWSSISIPFSKLIPGFDDVSSAEHSLQIIETQLVRSANGPLDVYWLAANRSAPDPAAVDVVLAQCRRWRALSLNMSSRDDLEGLRPATGRLVALEKLEVIGSGSGITVPDFFSVAPRLRQVSLANCRLVGSSPNIMLPWDQITHYRGIYSERTQLDILQMAPNMVKCAVSFTYPRDMSALDESCAILPHLRRLDIELPRFLIRINAPLLEELFCDSSWTMDVIALHHFVRRSGSACSLTKLTLRCCTISTELVAALRDLPALTFLLIECDDDSRPSPIEQHEALCDAMTISSAADVDTMCPSLTSLVYGFGRVFPQILPLFFAMVQSRIQGSCLARLRLYPAYARLEADLRIENAIQRLHDAGLDAAVVGEREAELLKTQAIFL